jgi:hypothetical protein
MLTYQEKLKAQIAALEEANSILRASLKRRMSTKIPLGRRMWMKLPKTNSKMFEFKRWQNMSLFDQSATTLHTKARKDA